MMHTRITRIGGPTVLLEVGNWRILTDPTFDPAGQRYSFGWGTTSRKVAGPAVPIAELGRIDAVLLSHHHHGDNLDRTARDLLPGWGTTLTTVAGASELGADAVGLTAGDRTTLTAPGKAAITVTATPCRHGPWGSGWLTGPVIGFFLEWEGQQHGGLWMTGDTVLYPGLEKVARNLRTGTLLMHLGAVRFPRLSGNLRYTMDAREGAALVDLVRPRHVVPVHYEGWTHFRQGRAAAEPVLRTSRLADAVTWLDPGGSLTLTV
jgi:L-ascorbate metabolism protein UlaG (beta-lactamase superfamily)